MGYTHALGMDAPVGVIRNRTQVVLHQTWRGQYALSTDNQGNETTCAPGGGCSDPYPWPGMAPFSYGLNPDFGAVHIWYGSLAKGQYDQSGLQYRRNRYYDPMTGQFTQDDPIGIAGGLNTYGYANGDPVNFSDPFGLCPEDRRDANGLCPGGLTVDEWDLVLAAAELLRQDAGRRLVELAEQGKIRPGPLPPTTLMKTGHLVDPSRIVTNTRYVRDGQRMSVLSGAVSVRDLAFSFAHELGHQALGRSFLGRVLLGFRRRGGLNTEAAANAYACSVTSHRSGAAGKLC